MIFRDGDFILSLSLFGLSSVIRSFSFFVQIVIFGLDRSLFVLPLGVMDRFLLFDFKLFLCVDYKWLFGRVIFFLNLMENLID